MALEPQPYYHEIALRFVREFPQNHLSRFSIDDHISSVAWTNYLESLDYHRFYFLESDIQEFREQEKNLDDRLKEGHVLFGFKVFKTYLERVRNRYEYTKQLLDKGFDLNKEETFVWKRRDAPWSADEKEWDDLWRKRIKNEYLQRLLVLEQGTNGVEDATDDSSGVHTNEAADSVGDIETLSPKEFILTRYRQMLTVLSDSGPEWVLQKYLSAFAEAYDPHSAYLPRSALENFNIQMKLSLVGIGAQLQSEDGAAKIVRLIPGGPADRDKREVRLRPGDKIIAVAQDGEPPVDIRHWPLSRVVQLIRGEKDTKVTLIVIPASDPTESVTKKVDLIRDEVKLEEQAAKLTVRQAVDTEGLTHDLGVIRLPTFYASMNIRSVQDPEYRSAALDVRKTLDEAVEKGVDGIILDLRSNGGGSLLEAIRTVGLFLRTGPVVQVRERYSTRVLPDDDPEVAYAGPLVVLVNRLSASASEIVAAALQDYGRGVIVGDSKTHGKGTVQTILNLGREGGRDGAIRVTTASYYRITGASTQLKGVAPDIIIASPYDFMEFGEDYFPNAMAWSVIEPAPYTPVADLGPIIAQLREQSIRRREKDPRFRAYRAVLDRIKEMNESREISLNIDERRQQAQTEREMQELQDALSEDVTDPTDNGEGEDIVLLEALRILADYATLHKDETVLQHETAPVKPESFAERLLKWLQDDQ